MSKARYHDDRRREVRWSLLAHYTVILTPLVRYLFSDKRTIEEVRGYCNNNAKDIIAIGFDPKKTFIFSDVRL